MSTSAVKPTPEGMHTITPHLVCKGASDAIEFYKKHSTQSSEHVCRGLTAR